MKNTVACILLLGLVMTAVWAPAFALDVPSKTTEDMAEVVGLSPDSGAPLGSDLVIQVLKETAPADAALKSLVDFVTVQERPPVRFFEEKVRRAIASLLPEGTDLDSFIVQEFSPMAVRNYTENYGDITVRFRFATEYADGQRMVALIGLVTGEAADGNPLIEWTPVGAEAEEGLVKVFFPGDLLLRLDGQDAMIAILSENAKK